MIKHSVLPGVLLGALLGAWIFTLGFLGWFTHPVKRNFFWFVIVIQMAVLSWSVARSARDGCGLGRRFAHGVGASLVAGLIVIGNSLLFTTTAFPHALEQLREMELTLLRDAGRSDDDIRAAVRMMETTHTPLAQALAGFAGTVVVGSILSLVLSLIFRGKKKEN